VSGERVDLFAGRAGIEGRFPEQFKTDWQRRGLVIGTLVVMTAVFVAGLVQLEIPFAKLIPGTAQLGDFVRLMLPPDPGTWAQLSAYMKAMGETLSIALLGTLGGAVLAFPMALLAARNVVANRIVHFLARRSLDTVRGIDTLIWALIWVSVVGLGPFAGILALVCSDFGSFGKLFSEAIETADKRPVEGVLSTGGSHMHGVRFGLLPQIIPVLASQVLYYFESNTRSATIIGIVGAGGIGAQLSEQIRVLEWQKVAFIILLILITVALIDWVSSKLRFAIIGRTAAAAH
jgi:phosphonate transport system permease protein